MTLRCCLITPKSFDRPTRHPQDAVFEKHRRKPSPRCATRARLLALTLFTLAAPLAGCGDLGQKTANTSAWKTEREAGQTALHAAQFETAQTHFDKALTLLQKENAADQKQLGGLLCESGRAALGLAQSERALNLFRDGLTRVEAYYGQKKLPHAEAMFRRALEIFEQAPPAANPSETKVIDAKIAMVLQDMARLLRKQGKEDQAQKIEASNSENSKPRFRLLNA